MAVWRPVLTTVLFDMANLSKPVANKAKCEPNKCMRLEHIVVFCQLFTQLMLLQLSRILTIVLVKAEMMEPNPSTTACLGGCSEVCV